MVKEIIFTATNKKTNLTGNPPIPATKSIPDWYKKMPMVTDESGKMKIINGSVNFSPKTCVPMLDAMTAGYTAVLDEDIQCEVAPDGLPYFRWRTDRIIITDHSPEQAAMLPIPEHYSSLVFKFENHFAVDLPKGYSLLVTHPANRFDLPFYTLSGVVDCDNYSLPIKFPFLIQKGYEGIIEKGTPVAQLIPIKRDAWQSSIGKFDEDLYYTKFTKYFSTLIRSYKNNHWVKKTYQ